jgi:hypothetical protein
MKGEKWNFLNNQQRQYVTAKLNLADAAYADGVSAKTAAANWISSGDASMAESNTYYNPPATANYTLSEQYADNACGQYAEAAESYGLAGSKFLQANQYAVDAMVYMNGI